MSQRKQKLAAFFNRFTATELETLSLLSAGRTLSSTAELLCVDVKNVTHTLASLRKRLLAEQSTFREN